MRRGIRARFRTRALVILPQDESHAAAPFLFRSVARKASVMSSAEPCSSGCCEYPFCCKAARVRATADCNV